MAENAATREDRQTGSKAVEEYREGVNNGKEESDVARKVSEKWGVPMKDIRERAQAGA